MIRMFWLHEWFSFVDTFEMDYEQRYPLMAKASYVEFDQLPGDLLIIPTGWFHQVCIVSFVCNTGVLHVHLSIPCVIVCHNA